MPQITSVILKTHDLAFPAGKKNDSQEIIGKIMYFNSLVWKSKKDSGISLKEPISGIKVPDELKAFEKDLIACHSLTILNN